MNTVEIDDSGEDPTLCACQEPHKSEPCQMTTGISSNIHSNIAFPACTSNEYMKDAFTLLPSLSGCINTKKLHIPY